MLVGLPSDDGPGRIDCYLSVLLNRPSAHYVAQYMLDTYQIIGNRT